MSNDKPEIRFRGFTNAWKQRKLGEVAVITGGGTPDTTKPEYWSGDIDWYSPSEIGEQIYVEGSQKKITKLGLEKSSAKILPVGTVLFTSRAGIGNTAILEKEGTTNQGFQSIIPYENELDTYFIFSRTHELKKYGEIVGAGSTFVEVSGRQMANMSINLPTLAEQATIGNFFRTLDDIITLHKRKLDGLKKLKKGYLQQMFPQKDETVPRLRFAGFTGNWEQRKLGEISTKVTDKNKNNEFSETLTNSAVHGIIRQRDFFDKDISNKKNLNNYFIVRPNDFVYNPRISNFAPVGPIKRNLLGQIGVMSPLYYVFRVFYGDLSFVEKYFESAYWHDFMILNGDNGVRSDRFNIKDSMFEKMPIPFPSIAEQRTIGSFFHAFDQQITTQAHRFEHLQILKKGLLQKMFI